MKEKFIYIGTGAGLVLFAIYGLLPGSFLGGIMGLNLSGLLFGYPVTSSLMPRIIVAVSMLLGVMVSGLVFIIAGSTLGWLLGSIVDYIRKSKEIQVTDKEIQNETLKR
ncbi:hypothetical protein BMS3Abin07_02121 [bacterium BMS3Abin07]|nr:hypothetical protein BMS3Abin07_02121 [bacterium BMS3Abin07]GBE31553.1 hypothetical protein BMS3Bbin05_00455 [bacterium BMS3Bbin05]HDO21562.1 hypothetical protein [Nitrospirota bacterium]HDZ87557.1 hypothetical protein [Nitrospirota bacterium]